MSLQKKNVIQEFIKDDFVPVDNQFLVKYCTGRGNNLHEVKCVDGSMILVSMPKKYRQTVWLKRDDCLVIDPIEEGKKVTGEIVCVLPYDTVSDLIKSRQWPKVDVTTNSNSTDEDTLLEFFSSNRKPNREQFENYPPSESSDDGEAEEDEDEEDEDEEEDAEDSKMNGESDTEECAKQEEKKMSLNITNEQSEASLLVASEDIDSATRDRNKSRVQLVTSGIVTVTNIINEGLSDDIQSLEFEADEEDSADELTRNSHDVQRHANAIRIQVNYNANDSPETDN